MTDSYMKNGSFTAQVPVGRSTMNGGMCIFPKEYEQIDTVTYNVNMLNQHELADGWVQILPFPRSITKKMNILDENGIEMTVNKNVKQLFKLRVTLAQLPQHLWHRINQYSRYNDTSFVVKNRIYHYLVEKTSVDNEIRELYKLTTLVKDEQVCRRINELLQILKDNDVYGWVVIRARNYMHV
jgi:hypothetical protein